MASITGVSRGRRLLLSVLQRTTATDVAARCGVYQQRVSEWSNGDRAPSHAARILLFANYGIPYNSWEMPFISSMGDALHRPKYT